MSELKTSLVLSLRDGVIAPRSRPGSPGGARPDARRLPATGLGWRQRNGPATGLRPASATAPASSRRYSPAARRSRPAHRRSRLCLRGTTARCTPPGAGNCPARILRSSLRVTNPAAIDPRPDRATAPPPGPPPQSSPGHCLLGRPSWSTTTTSPIRGTAASGLNRGKRKADLEASRGHLLSLPVASPRILENRGDRRTDPVLHPWSARIVPQVRRRIPRMAAIRSPGEPRRARRGVGRYGRGSDGNDLGERLKQP